MPKEKKVTVQSLEAGARLRAAREAIGLTQEAFADAIGVGRSVVAMAETGANDITLPLCVALYNRYRIDAAWIAHGDPSRLPHHLADDVLRFFKMYPPKRPEDIEAKRAIKASRKAAKRPAA